MLHCLLIRTVQELQPLRSIVTRYNALPASICVPSKALLRTLAVLVEAIVMLLSTGLARPRVSKAIIHIFRRGTDQGVAGTVNMSTIGAAAREQD
jgi:hypothetical protein